MKKSQLVGSGMLLLAAVIWGCAFVAQSVAMDNMGPFTFGALRFALGGLTLLPVIGVVSLRRRRAGRPAVGSVGSRLVGGTVCGVFLFLASAAQQIGLIYTSVGKSGFITALYVVFVPIAAWVVFRRKMSALLIFSVAAAVCGLYLLCINGGMILNIGDVYTLAAALLFTGQILAVDHYGQKMDAVQLSCLQFFTCALLNAVAAAIWEPPVTWAGIAAVWLPIAYTGILSCGVAYTFQILGQQRTPPAAASLLMSLESVFSVLGGAVILGQWLTLRELLGCCLMFMAVVVAQLPVGRTKKQKVL